jgi:hypothetical protein
MTENFGKWPSGHRQTEKSGHRMAAEGKTTPTAAQFGCHRHEIDANLLVWTAPDGIKRARMRSL